MRELAPTNELTRLWWVARQKYAYFITKDQLRKYLSKRQIRYKDYNSNMVRDMGNNIPIGTERIKNDGMIQVKISPSKWEYKNRLVYSQYHNVKLTNDDYIIFLDQDRTNFNIDNLKLVSRHESSILSNQKMFSKDARVTNAGIQVAKLIIKTKILERN